MSFSQYCHANIVCLVTSYVDDLSVKKQDKALIHSGRARNIRTVLIEPKNTAVESAQFRYAFSPFHNRLFPADPVSFWVKKMFKLQTVGIGTAEVRPTGFVTT